jgi:Tfp pilus assembly protein PilP
LAAAGLAAGQTVPAPAVKKELPPLIRRDLIPAAARTFPPLKRDPFSAQIFAGNETAVPAGGGGFAGIPPEVKPAEEPPPILPVAFRFVGYIKSSAGLVGLVLFQGQALAVREGDEAGPGWKVVRITAKEIEIQGPDGKTQVFPLEGVMP